MRVALFNVTISNCCSKGIIGGIISFIDNQCIMNYNQNNSFFNNTVTLGKVKIATKAVQPQYCSQLWICKSPAPPDDHLQKAGPSE